MSAALKLCKVNDKFQDPLFIFLELIRGGVLHGKLWGHRAYSGGPSFGEGALSSSRCSVTRKQQANRDRKLMHSLSFTAFYVQTTRRRACC